jgi:hypothetical protein
MFKPLPRAITWASTLAALPTLTPPLPKTSWIAPVTTIQSPLNFVPGMCPVTQETTVHWTELERVKAAAGFAPANLKELDAKVQQRSFR